MTAEIGIFVQHQSQIEYVLVAFISRIVYADRMPYDALMIDA